MAAFRDLTGLRFGRLVVVGFAGAARGSRYWETACDCGNKKTIAAGNLTAGRTKSCGCLQKHAMRARLKDLTGKIFGRLTVISLDGFRGAWSYWNTECACGRKKVIKGALLINGQTRSCGCLSSETTAARNKANLKHGASHTAEYRVWHGMKGRCYNPNSTKFHLWGGRGIEVCDAWMNSFETFLRDMGPRPSARHSIDRFPNGSGNYGPGNCRWATYSEQNSNRRTYTRRRSIKESGSVSHGRP